MSEKLAIIMAGGGVRSSFSAGALDALVKKYKIAEPFLLICGSGSVGTGAYYLTKQYKAIYELWTGIAPSKRILNIWRFWKVIDIDYLIDVIFKKKKPLLEKKVYKSKTKYLIAALNKDNGKVGYLDSAGANIFEKMRAAKAIPIIFKLNPRVKINGINYCDSAKSANPYVHIKKAVESGADKILIIDNGEILDNIFFKVVYSGWLFSHGLGSSYYEEEKQLLEYKVPKKVKVFTISPDEKMKMTPLSNDKILLKKTFKQGRKKVNTNKDLNKFLKTCLGV